jgi:putative membrane protein
MTMRFLGLAASMTAVLGLSLATAGADNLKQAADKGKGLDDQTFVQKATYVNLAEINIGRLAARGAQSDEVKRFGEKMARDHGKANEDLIQIANKARLQVPARTDAPHQMLMEKLAAKAGSPAFDQEYMQAMVKGHKEAAELFQNAANSLQNKSLKEYAQKTLGEIREHQKAAEQIAGKLKGGADKEKAGGGR